VKFNRVCHLNSQINTSIKEAATKREWRNCMKRSQEGEDHRNEKQSKTKHVEQIHQINPERRKRSMNQSSTSIMTMIDEAEHTIRRNI